MADGAACAAVYTGSMSGAAAPSKSDVHLVDGTYELFRHYYAVPRSQDRAGLEIGAVRGVLASMLALLRNGATHIGVATDHVIESFRNEMWHGYKRGDGIDPDLLAQFEPLERALETMGIVVWPMREYEADDALASAAAGLTSDQEVGRVFICTPDKDLAQCVVDNRVVQLDRRARTVRGVGGVLEKFGVLPASIPDYLALVGDSADGYPGVVGWGAKSSSMLLRHYGYLEAIPRTSDAWQVQVRGANRLAVALTESWDDALLFRDLATLRTDAVVATAEALRWEGPTDGFVALADHLGASQLAEQAAALAAAR
ncbi:MAG TPA: 5'-3' exonuclease H3TH domain-containing protein [Acidobacteriota bacterium]|nr:5'-3' exonuclease H3TH domain-containing protein [Acidobacteriota bacterium]